GDHPDFAAVHVAEAGTQRDIEDHRQIGEKKQQRLTADLGPVPPEQANQIHRQAQDVTDQDPVKNHHIVAEVLVQQAGKNHCAQVQKEEGGRQGRQHPAAGQIVPHGGKGGQIPEQIEDGPEEKQVEVKCHRKLLV